MKVLNTTTSPLFFKTIIAVFAFIFVDSIAYSQSSDDFTDGDFTASPTWVGSTADFIVNSSQELQLNATVAGTSYLSTPHNLANFDNKEWSFWIKQSFAGSSSNFGRVYLISQSSDLTTDPDGVYLQLGESLSTDAVRLMQRSGGTTTQLCASADGSISGSFTIRTKIVRNNTGNWSLYIDFAGGTNYALIATASEVVVPTGTDIGYLCTYTSGNITKFYLDDVYAGDEIIDTAPPTMVSVQVIDATNIDVLFSEALNQSTAENISNYDIIPFNGVTTATLDGTNPALVHLQLASNMSNGNTYTLTTQNIEDISGNPSISQSLNFAYLVADTPAAGDLIINEFMADPSPVVGLPDGEFVEIHNVSSKIFNLNGWKLGDNSTFGTIQAGWILPGEFKVLCPSSFVDSFTNSIAVTSFPSLNNSSDDIILMNDSGLLLDKISYTIDWYQDAVKKDGGWSIERINPMAPCSQASNWKASTDPTGGTPGTQNSAYDTTPDTSTPFIQSAFVVSPNDVQVTFNKPVDSTALSIAGISTTPTLTEINRIILSEHPLSFTVQFSENINESQSYTITINGVQDCWGNIGNSTQTFILPSEADSGDVIINEVLFDSYTGGSDWVKL